MTETGILRSRPGWAAALAWTVLGVLHGVLLYGSAGRDDSHITFSVARQLAQSGRLLNINGEAIEQTSSLLHVLLLALCFRITQIPLPTLGVLFSAAVGAATSLVAWMGARRLGLRPSAFVPFYLAIFPCTVYWSFGGLEVSLAAFVTLLAIWCIVGVLSGPPSWTSRAMAALALGALVIVRPESIHVIAAALAAVAALLATTRHEGPFAAKLLFLIGVAAFVFGAVCAFRFFVFGQVFPQTVYAKSAGVTHRGVMVGLTYLMRGYQQVSLGLLTAFAGLALGAAVFPSSTGRPIARPSRSARTWLIVLMSFVAAQLAFVVASGGDWMEGSRFFVPIVAPLALGGVYGISLLPRRTATAALAVVAAAASVDLYRFQRESKGTPIWHVASYRAPVLADFEVPVDRFSPFELNNRVHLRDVPMVLTLSEVVRQLRVEGVQPVTIFSMQMGMVPFHVTAEHAGGTRFVDIASLATRDFTDCSVTAGAPRTAFGAVVSYGVFFEHEAAIRERCAIERPDVIFDLGPNEWGDPQAQVARRGYRIVFSARGDLPGEGLGRVSGLQFIGVREDLADAIALPRPRYVWPAVTR